MKRPQPYQEWVLEGWNNGESPVDFGAIRDFDPAVLKHCPEPWRSLFIATAGFAGETGELIEHLKKLVRNGTLDRQALLLEMGDAHFYLTFLAGYFGFTMEQIEQANKAKLTARRAEAKRLRAVAS